MSIGPEGRQLLPDWVARRARTHPDHPALEWPSGRLTYAQLESRVASTARALRELDLRPAEPFAVLMGNSAEFAVFAHAVPRAGAAFMPLNARLTAAELAWQLRDCGARLVVTDAEHADAARKASEGAAIRLLDAEDARWGAALACEDEARYDPAQVHSVIYTSGTSGRPKGALLSYGNFYASACASAFNLGIDPRDRWLACMPLFHVGGLSILLRSAIYGTTAVLHPRFEAGAVNRALREQGVTLLSVVATMLQRMLDADDAPYPPSVRAVLVGGGPVAPALLEAALARGLPVLQTYGLTEAASQVATLSAADALRKLGSAGLPLLETTVRIEAERREAEPGEVGEILVSGPTVSRSYLRSDGPGLSAGGWLRTGDLGYLDEEGYLYVSDRRDDLIVSGGENVYPAEVEAALLAHPDVAECAVVGLPSDEWGSLVAAVIVPAPGHHSEAAGLDTHLRARLAGYKLPRRYEFSAEPLPRTASGKLLRRLVRERLLAQSAPSPSMREERDVGAPTD